MIPLYTHSLPLIFHTKKIFSVDYLLRHIYIYHVFYLENSESPKATTNSRLIELTDPGILSILLPKYKAAPLVGLEYILEVLQPRGDPAYYCAMCNFKTGPVDIMYHLISAQHRLNYLVNTFFIHVCYVDLRYS